MLYYTLPFGIYLFIGGPYSFRSTRLEIIEFRHSSSSMSSGYLLYNHYPPTTCEQGRIEIVSDLVRVPGQPFVETIFRFYVQSGYVNIWVPFIYVIPFKDSVEPELDVRCSIEPLCPFPQVLVVLTPPLHT